MIKTRRYDLDWLRLIAFGVLIYFHAAIIFVPDGLPLIQNDQTSALMDKFVNFSSQFRLALLFLISGVGVAFARRRRSTGEFLIERSTRLLVPFAIGLLLLVPLMVYFERLHQGAFTGSFLSFYPSVFTTGVYPTGNLSWHHFWFIAYLYLFCVIGVKVFSYFEGDKGQDFLDNLAEWFRGYNIYGFIFVLLVAEVPLRIVFPGFRDLIHDWASFSHWFLIFLVGYVLANRESLLDEITRIRFVSLLGAGVSTYLLFAWFYDGGNINLHRDDPDIVLRYLGYCVTSMTMVWCCLLTCVGFAGKYLRFTNPLLRYLNEAVYPLFILHLTVIVILGYVVVPLPWSITEKYLAITTLTVVICLVIYHLAIRPFNLTRLLFGVKPLPVSDVVDVAERKV